MCSLKWKVRCEIRKSSLSISEIHKINEVWKIIPELYSEPQIKVQNSWRFNTILKVWPLYYVFKLRLTNSTEVLHFLQSHKGKTISSKHQQELHCSQLWVHINRITDDSYFYQSCYTVGWDPAVDTPVPWCVGRRRHWSSSFVISFLPPVQQSGCVKGRDGIAKGIFQFEWGCSCDLRGSLQSKTRTGLRNGLCLFPVSIL